MKLSCPLFRHHVGRMVRRHWFVQGNIKVIPTETEKILKSYGYDVVDVKTLLNPPTIPPRHQINGLFDKELPFNENHPDYKIEPCFLYRDENVLLEGLEQAKALTNTVEYNYLPDIVTEFERNVNISDQTHSEIKKRIMLSCVFEATQEKLPKRKDPSRPAWNFPRDYGITQSRQNELLCRNLLTIFDQFINNKDISSVNDVFFSAPIEAYKKKIQFEITSEQLITTSKKLKQIAEKTFSSGQDLPNLYPVDCTVSLTPTNFYQMKTIYPLNLSSKYPFVQTALLHYDSTKIKNLFEEPVTEEQIHGRSLLKGFSIAVAQARTIFGENVTELPEPIVVPVVHVEGNVFHFSVYQLNTLVLDRKTDIRNIYWNSERIRLYDICEYNSGKPVLENYNKDVITKLIAFINLE